MQQLNPKAVWLFFIKSFFKWIILAMFLAFNFSAILNEGEATFSSLGLYLAIFVIVAAIVAFISAKLTYYFYRYELGEDGFKKEMGIIWKKYVTIPYDRIQNIDITRGVMDRILGLSDLYIQTAGSSSQMVRNGGVIGAEGRLPGLLRDDAERIKDELIRRAKQTKNQGI